MDDSRVEFQFRGNLYQSLNLVVGTTADWFVGQVPVPSDLINHWDYAIYALYGQLEYTYNTTRLIVGMQYNKVESIQPQTVPRIAIIQDFNQYAGLKLQYAEAFRAPYPAETSLHPSTPTIILEKSVAPYCGSLIP